MRLEPIHGAARALLLVLPLITLTAVGCRPASQDAPFVPEIASDLVQPPPDGAARDVVFAGGCFWCTEAVFEELVGVQDVVSGYAGGTAETARYKLVSSGATDHAEAIQITYDPAQISYGQLLEVFFSVAHDPTQLNYQGPDHGRQYRSAVFFASEEEQQTVAAYIRQLDESKVHGDPIVTTLEPLQAFYPAEEDHQDFVRRNPRHGYVVQQALPKVAKLKKRFRELLAP